MRTAEETLRKFVTIHTFGDVNATKVSILQAMEEYANECVKAKCTIPVVSGSLPLVSAEFIKWLMDDKHDYVYVNGEFIEQWTNVEFTISELYDQWSMERRQANDR